MVCFPSCFTVPFSWIWGQEKAYPSGFRAPHGHLKGGPGKCCSYSRDGLNSVLDDHFRHLGLKQHCPMSKFLPSRYPFPKSSLHLAPSSLQGGPELVGGGDILYPVCLCCTGKVQKIKKMAAPITWNHNELAALPCLWLCPSINIIPFIPLGYSHLCIMLGLFWPL